MQVIKKTVAVIGLGYIGLPTALLMAKAGFRVKGVDVNLSRIALLKKGQLPFTEPGLDKLFTAVKRFNPITFSNQVVSSQVYLIAVPTPQRRGRSNLKYVFSALESVHRVYQFDQLVIIESTIGPQDFKDSILPSIRQWGGEVRLAHCPERAIPGRTLDEMVHNHRIVGGLTKSIGKETADIYAQFVKGKLYCTSLETAAFVKVAENTYRMANIALANELTMIAHDLGLNSREIIELANLHPRVNIHQPGPGVGGHCLPIDPWFLVSASKHHQLVKLALQTNQHMPEYVVAWLKKLLKDNGLANPTIGILGYAYKADVGDTRETPAQDIVVRLQTKYRVLINDELAQRASVKLVPLDQLLSQSQVVILVTPHSVYKKIMFAQYPQVQLVCDTRGLFTRSNFKNSRAKLYTL